MSGRIIITFTGPTPSIVTETDGVVAPPPPPPPPPAPPPPSTTPFVWPPDWYAAVDPAARAAAYWVIPGRTEYEINGKVYAFQQNTGNPIGSMHHNAGIIQGGPYAGLRLWAPLDAPTAMLQAILATSSHP